MGKDRRKRMIILFSMMFIILALITILFIITLISRNIRLEERIISVLLIVISSSIGILIFKVIVEEI
jgi:TctA family transporter